MIVSLPVCRIDVLLQALRADFLHHALHRRVDARDADVLRLEVRRQHAVARRLHRRHHAVRSDRDDAIDGVERHERLAELAVLVRQHRLHDVAAEMRVLRPPGRDRRADVGAPDHLIGGRLDLLALEQVLALLVAGEVDHAVAVRRASPSRSRTARRCRGRRRAAARSGRRESRSARRSAPSRRPARPCCRYATSRLDTPSSSAMSDSSPRSLSTQAPVSAIPSISSGTSADARGAIDSKFCSR